MLWKELDRELIFLDLDVQCSDQVMGYFGRNIGEGGILQTRLCESPEKKRKRISHRNRYGLDRNCNSSYSG